MNETNKPAQPARLQSVECAKKSSGALPHSHTMPGLVEPLARSFWQDRRNHSPRGMARNNEVAETHQVGACLRDLNLRLRAVESAVFDVPTVRDFRVFPGGRAA